MNIFKIFSRKKEINHRLNISALPNHIAFIMDGNGRWAKKRGLPRTMGHKKGAETLKKILRFCYDIGIKTVSIYAFSTENFKRDKAEVEAIFDYGKSFIKDFKEYLNSGSNNNDCKVVAAGDITMLPQDLQDSINEIMETTKNNVGHILNVAICYSGREEIVRAFKLIQSAKEKDITEQTISDYLYTAGQPDPDFVIRTSGEYRLSNFMMYQCAYSELYFTKTLWPDFDEKQLTKALIDFQKRDRRFGAVKKQK